MAGKRSQIIADFHVMVPGANPHAERLQKIFMRKIKRAKKRDNEGSDSEESESSDDEDYYDESDEEDDLEYMDDSCPDGCDQSLYDKVIALREKRLDHEDILAEFQKSVDELKKGYDRLQQREKQVNKDIASSILEIQSLQNEKQKSLMKSLYIVCSKRVKLLTCCRRLQLR